MDPGVQTIKIMWAAIRFLFKPVMKFLIFTGLLYPALVRLFYIDSPNTPIPGYVWAVSWILCIYFFAQNMVRLITKDRAFSFVRLVFGQGQSRREKIATNPTIARELIVKEPHGVIFGKKGDSYVIKPETLDGHILVIGGVGSGKSSCLAIPSLLSWRERVFAIDIKGELYEKTRHKRPNIKVLNPLSTSSPGYNPFYIFSSSNNLVQDAREIALSLMPKPENIKDPFWIDGAQNIFTGAILHFYGLGHSFIDTITEIQSIPIKELVTEIHNSDTNEARPFVNQFVGMDMKTLASIASEMANKIMVFATDKDIKACFSKKETITPDDLEHGEDIYINIPESKIEQWKNILTLIVNQHLKHFERRPDMNATPILFLLDEFPRLSKVESIVNALATLRSKKITICLLIQSLAQLDMIYSKEARQVIADTCQYKVILNATDADTQEYFSRIVGTYDKQKKSQTANFEQYTGMGRGTSENRTTEEKRIIKPEKFATLQEVVVLTPFGFFRAKKTPYYKEKVFMS